MKARRLTMQLFQSEVAARIGVHIGSVQNWERNLGAPAASYVPAVVRFLGYIPFQHDGTVGGRIRWLRLCAGWTQSDLAAAAGCDEATIWRWETNHPRDRRLWVEGVAKLNARLMELGFEPHTGRALAALTALTAAEC